MAKEVQVNDINNLIKENNTMLIDVRERFELVETGFVPGAVHLPMSTFDIEDQVLSDNKDKTIYVMCRSGRRSESVQEFMLEHGFDAVNVAGGILEYDGEVDQL